MLLNGGTVVIDSEVAEYNNKGLQNGRVELRGRAVWIIQ